MFPDSRAGCTFPTQSPGELGDLLAQTQSLLICPCFILANWNCFPKWICQLTICLGTQLGVLRGFPQSTSALPVLCFLDGRPWVRTDKVPGVLSIKLRRWVHIAHWLLFYIICGWAQTNMWALDPLLQTEGLGRIELRAPSMSKVHWLCSNFFLEFIYFMCMSVSLACMSGHHMRPCSQQRSREVIRSPGPGVKGGCESPYGSNSDPLQEQVLWTAELSPALTSQKFKDMKIKPGV